MAENGAFKPSLAVVLGAYCCPEAVNGRAWESDKVGLEATVLSSGVNSRLTSAL